MKYSNAALSPGHTALLEDFPTTHKLVQGDARSLSFIADESIHLVITSPPYWTLKRYNVTVRRNRVGRAARRAVARDGPTG